MHWSNVPLRAWFAALGLGSLGVVALGMELQALLRLAPCPLCIFQRIAYAALGLVFLLGGLHSPRSPGGRGFYGVLVLLASAVGIGIAGRHVWLQSLPKELAPSCGPPLSFLQETHGPLELVRKVLTGTGNCGDVDWTLFGLSMPAWSLAGFVLLALWGLFAAFRRRKGRNRL